MVSEYFSLKPYNTFGISTTARYWATFGSTEELREIVVNFNEKGVPWYILGGGSNIILTGEFQGAILHPTTRGIEVVDRTDDVLVRAEAGVVWDEFVGWAVEQDLAGVENLSYIPGYVGAAPVQNIGAYGAEVKDTIEWVEYLDAQTMELRTILNRDCGFGYRESIFKHELKGRAIVTAVVFRLKDSSQGEYGYNIGYGDLYDRVMGMGGVSLANVRAAVTRIRKEKLPEPTVFGNAGSFFKNPMIPVELFEQVRGKYPEMPSYPCADGRIKVPAAWLIDQAGWKGYRATTVGVHPKQALVVINLGGATAKDILGLGRSIIEDVRLKFGVEIEMEVNVL